MHWDGLNRRKFPRVIYPCLVKLTSDDGTPETILTHTENLGIGGLCLIVKKEIKCLTAVSIELDLIEGEHVQCAGKVVWSVRRKAIEQSKPLFYDIGVEFVGLKDQHKIQLQETVERLIKKGAKILQPYV